MPLFQRKMHGRWDEFQILGIKLKLFFRERQIQRLFLSFDKNAGLGNRILPLISYSYFFNPTELSFFWDSDGWVKAPFSELFKWESEGKIIREQQQQTPPVGFTTIQSPGIFLLLKGADKDKTPRRELFEKTKNGQFLRPVFHETPLPLKKAYSDQFRKLKPADPVKERMAQMGLSEDFVAIQVRNNSDWAKYGRNCHLNEFFAAIDKIPNKKPLFLSAMSKEVAEAFRTRFPRRIFELPSKNYSSMIDATADLFILGTASQAIYSHQSTFAELAWRLGGAKAEVSLVGGTF